MRTLLIINFLFLYLLHFSQSPAFLWAEKFAGQSTLAKGNSIKTDVLGNIYTTGHFSGIVDFNPGAGTFTINSVPSLNNDIYISKLDIDGNYIWAKAFGGIGNETGLSIAVDLFGNVYACGIFSTTADFEHALATSFEQRTHIQQGLKSLFEANSGAAKKVAEQTLNHLS